MSIIYPLTIYILRGFFPLFYHYQVYGANQDCKGCAILAPNHTSFLDPPLIGAAWPEELHFLARSCLFRPFILRWLLPRLNAHPVEGSTQDIPSFRKIFRLLKEGKKVVVFPEGIRSATGELQTLKSGIAMLALRMHCPIIPVYISGTFEAWPRHRLLPKFGARIACVFGQPIYPPSSSEIPKKVQQEALAGQLEKKLEELRVWLEAGAEGAPP